MEETQTPYLSLHCRLCSVFQTNALPAPMIPWYGFLLGALTSQLYSPFKISFFFSLTAIQIPSPRAFAGSSFTLHSLWGSLASATSEDSQTCTLNQSLSSELRNQQHICLLDISAWTTHFAQSVCPYSQSFQSSSSCVPLIIRQQRHLNTKLLDLLSNRVFKERSLTEPEACISLRLINSAPESGL